MCALTHTSWRYFLHCSSLSFTPLPSPHTRCPLGPRALLDGQGRIFAAGGICEDGPTAAVESWAPGEAAWRREADLPGPRFGTRRCCITDITLDVRQPLRAQRLTPALLRRPLFSAPSFQDTGLWLWLGVSMSLAACGAAQPVKRVMTPSELETPSRVAR